MWAAILAFLQAIPGIEKMIAELVSVFKKTPEQKQQSIAEDEQKSEQSFKDTGRPL